MITECRLFMKEFFERYSYDSVRMALNQVAIAIFGCSLALATKKAGNDTLLLITSIGSIIFYLALNYGVASRVGTRDKTTIDHGSRPFRPLTGLWIALLANSLNILLALLVIIGIFAGADGLAAVSGTIALFAQGMYQGVLYSVGFAEQGFAVFWWAFLVLPLPSMLISFIGYIAGVKDIRLTRMGVPDLPESDRPTKQELKEKKHSEKKNKP